MYVPVKVQKQAFHSGAVRAPSRCGILRNGNSGPVSCPSTSQSIVFVFYAFICVFRNITNTNFSSVLMDVADTVLGEYC